MFAVVQEGGTEFCIFQRDRQHGAHHAEPGQAFRRDDPDGGKVGAAEVKGQEASPKENGSHGKSERRLPEASAADRTEHVRRTGTRTRSAGEAAIGRRKLF